MWRPHCASRDLRRIRRLLFTTTKRVFWSSVIAATTHPTTPPTDAYEDPREIKTININRVRATPQNLASISPLSKRLQTSVFGQLYSELREKKDVEFRRAYLGKGHGGQHRSFKVKFQGEGVNDYGGPYRAVFEQVVDELQSDQLSLSNSPKPVEACLFPLLTPCPNRSGGVGANQDKFILAPGAPPKAISDLVTFLGKLVGTAVRHGLQMGFDFPTCIWKILVGQALCLKDLESFDSMAVQSVHQISQVFLSEEPSTGWQNDLQFSAGLSDGSSVSLAAHSGDLKVTVDNWKEFVKSLVTCRLLESWASLNAFRRGLAAVLPMELCSLFTPNELETLICGTKDVDISLLQQNTEYEQVDPNEPHIQYFWRVLEEMRPEERTQFLRFVWARSRMPQSVKDFSMRFKLQAPQATALSEPDQWLPHAQTCFFSLSLPRYSSAEVLREKLLFAIQNSPNMDADVLLHSAEGWGDA